MSKDRWQYKLADAFGYELIKKKKLPSLNTHLINLYEKLKIHHVFDVGANVGQFAKGLRTAGFLGKIYSFEPVLDTFKLLEQNSQHDEHWHCFNLALGSENKMEFINKTSASELASFRTPSRLGKELFGDQIMKTDDLVEVEVKTLDSFISTIENLKNSDQIFLKMDTQGFDLEVLKGALNTLDRISGLLSELSVIPIYDGMPNYIEALTKYNQAGFAPVGFYPVAKLKERPVCVEFDCVMVKKYED